MSTLARTIEGQDWQRECHVCERVTCAKPEKVAEFLEELIAILHRQVLPDLGRRFGWRNQVAHYEALLQLYVRSWAWALKGVCPNCISKVAPELDAYLGNAELVHEDALARWH